VKKPFLRAAESACEAVLSLEPDSSANARPAAIVSRAATLRPSSVEGYESGVFESQKGNSGSNHCYRVSKRTLSYKLENTSGHASGVTSHSVRHAEFFLINSANSVRER
jgi:hypothetical protein